MTPHARIVPSSHARYKFEVIAPARVFGRRVRQYFASRAEAQVFLTALQARVTKDVVAPVTRDEQLLLARWRATLSVADMESAFSSAATRNAVTDRPLSDALAAYLADLARRAASGDVSALHLRSCEHSLGVLERHAPGLCATALRSLDAPSVQVALDALPLAPRTRLNVRKVLRAALHWVRRAGWLPPGHTNPVADTLPPATRRPTPGIITAPQMSALLAAADVLTLRWLVFGGFCGLRTSEVDRLQWEDIRWDAAQPQLYVSPGKTRNAERWVMLTPPVLALRERLAPEASGPVLLACGVKHSATTRARARTFARAGFTPPPNGLRHSYGSYHLVHYGDAARTAMEMGHYAPAITFNFYRRAVSASEAAAWWSLASAPPLPPASLP